MRESFELAEARVPGAINIPLGELAVRQTKLDHDRPVAVICRSGDRSALAVQHLRQLGVDATNVAGGIIGWQHDDHLGGQRRCRFRSVGKRTRPGGELAPAAPECAPRANARQRSCDGLTVDPGASPCPSAVGP